MLTLWTIGTAVARRLVHEAVPDHLVLPLETFATLSPGTALDGAVVRSARRVDVRVGATSWALVSLLPLQDQHGVFYIHAGLLKSKIGDRATYLSRYCV